MNFKTSFILISLLCFSFPLWSEVPFRTIENKAFKEGEVLKYKISMGWVTGGVAELKVMNDPVEVKGRPCYHVVAQGNTVGMFDWIYKVREDYQSYIDKQALVPLKFSRDVKESSYTLYNELDFDHPEEKVVSKRSGEHEVPPFIQDILSAFYFARTTHFDDLAPGDTIKIETFFDEEIFPLIIKYNGRETVKTSVGKVKCLAFTPLVQTGRVFESKDDMTLWVSDDLNHIPVRISSKIWVGTLKFDLVEYSGLKNPIALEE